MPTVLVIAGLVIAGVGVALIVFARVKPEPSQEEIPDIGNILEQFNKLLELIEARYRIGVVLIAAGLALVGLGAWWEAKDAGDSGEADAAPALVRR